MLTTDGLSKSLNHSMSTATETPRIAARKTGTILGLLLIVVLGLKSIIVLKDRNIIHTSDHHISTNTLHTSPKHAGSGSHNHTQYQRTRAVVHMGVHKTGTTSIQSESRLKMEQLKLDGYLMPWALMREEYADGDFGDVPFCRKSEAILRAKKPQAQTRFATCFFSENKKQRVDKPCVEELLCYGSEIAKRRQNLFISSEAFDHIGGEEIKRLKTYLSSWDETVIVVYHRIFYRWLVSTYNQRQKGRIERRAGFTIVDYIRQKLTTGHFHDEHYSYNLVQRLQGEFGNQTVIMNYDDRSMGGSDESFYCNAMPDATNTCRAIREDDRGIYTNKAVPFDYEDLVYGAIQAKLIDASVFDRKQEFQEIAIAAQRQQEKIYNTTKTNLKRICPERDVLDSIWEFTMLAQKSMFPQDFLVNASITEATMRSDFEEVAQTTLCTLDIDSTLNETVWQDFFKAFNSDNN